MTSARQQLDQEYEMNMPSPLIVNHFGWHVFPVRPLRKFPGLVPWGTAAINDPKQIAEWWKRWPNANVGVDCGRSEILVLDVDRHSPDKNGR
jgi:hypothetical protein